MPFNTSKKSLQPLTKVVTKEVLREQMKAKLSLIGETSLSEMSSLLAENLNQLLKSLNVIQENKLVGVFAPIAKEPLWFLAQSTELEALTAYPALEASLMIFKTAKLNELVVRKDFGFEILGPADNAAKVTPSVIMLPGLAFTEKGERLGRGKGFYDKYLNNYHGIKIGLCFSGQIVKKLPIEKHDVSLDYIVTDKKIINCKFALKNNKELV